MTTSTGEVVVSGTSAAVPSRLDDLLRADAETLRRLYVGARTPAVTDLTGDMRGRMLALVAIPGWLFWWARLLARTPLFPWLGKSFFADGPAATRGTGINRVFTDTIRWFKFDTFIGPSRAGDFAAFQLDYDNPGNPSFIRAIKDEVRELKPGLFLGQAYFKTRKREILMLYFGLEKPVQKAA
jgi:hypothetical protein